jgi:predicted permease
LKNGVSIDAALADLTTIAKQLEREYPDSNREQGAAIAPLKDVIVGNVRPILLALLGGAGLLLLIANINVAGLMLVRFESRKREIAVRAALGASSGRLLSQFVTEAVVLIAGGTLLGLAFAHWTMELLASLAPADVMARMPFLQGVGLNARVAGFAAAIVLLTTAAFALAPIVGLRSHAVHEGLAEGSRGSAGMVWRRLGAKLVVVELTTAVVLLASAGLLGKSLYRLLHVNLGLQPDHLITMDISAPKAAYNSDAEKIALAREVVSRVEGVPGVRSVGISTNGLPVTGNGNTTWFRVLGRPWHGEHNDVPERDVSPGYFSTLGTQLLRGRHFDEAEDASKPHVAIINRAFARQYFPDEDPLGQHLTYLSDKVVPIEIVGIVDDIRQGPLDAPIPPVLYVPFNQSTDRYFSLVVRSSQGASILTAVAAAVKQIDPNIVTLGGMTMTGRIHDSPSAYLHRSSAWLAGGFAALALILGSVGLYGVVAYSVAQRTREIGVRIALGAQASSVHWLILREAGVLTGAGIAAGLACAVGVATSMSGLLFGVATWDVPTLAAVAGILSVAALLASYIPARRAASVSPIEALRF